MENKSPMHRIFYCLPGHELQALSILLHDEEFTRQLWVDAQGKFSGETERHQIAETDANKHFHEFSRRLEELDGREELVEQLLEYTSRCSDAGLAFANDMFIKGLVYGFAFLGQALADRNKRITAS